MANYRLFIRRARFVIDFAGRCVKVLDEFKEDWPMGEPNRDNPEPSQQDFGEEEILVPFDTSTGVTRNGKPLQQPVPESQEPVRDEAGPK